MPPGGTIRPPPKGGRDWMGGSIDMVTILRKFFRKGTQVHGNWLA